MLKKFCCCCSLHKAIVPIAAFNTLYCALILTSIIYQLWDNENAVTLTVLIAILPIYSIVNISLVYGAYKKRPTFLVPFLIVDGILLILTALLFTPIIGFSFLFVYGRYLKHPSDYDLHFHIFIFGVRVYFWICVVSYSQLLYHIDAQRLIGHVAARLTEIVALPPPYDPPPPYEKLEI